MRSCEKMPTENSTCASCFVSWYPCRQGVKTCQRGCKVERTGPNWAPLLCQVVDTWLKWKRRTCAYPPRYPGIRMQPHLCTSRISWVVCTNGALAGRRIGLRTGERSVLNAPGARS